MKKTTLLLTIFLLFYSCTTLKPTNIRKKENKTVAKTVKKASKKKKTKIEKRKKSDASKMFFLTVCKNSKIDASKISEGKILFVDISATWCEPCKKLANYVEKLKLKFPNKVKFIRVFPLIDKSKITCENSDKNTFFSIDEQEGYPRVLIFDKKGNLVADETGLYPLLFYYGTLMDIE